MEYNNQENTFVPQPNDYKVWSIVNLVVSILFCCSCTGIVSLVLSIIALMKSNDVNIYQADDYVHAYLEDNITRYPETVDLFVDEADYKSNTNGQSYQVRRGQSLLYDKYKV